MTQLRAIVVLVLWAIAFPGVLCGQQRPDLELEALTDRSWVEYDYNTGLGTGTNGVLVRYGDTVLTADRVSVNRALEQVTAEGAVRIQHGEQIWVGEHIRYNFKTRGSNDGYLSIYCDFRSGSGQNLDRF